MRQIKVEDILNFIKLPDASLEKLADAIDILDRYPYESLLHKRLIGLLKARVKLLTPKIEKIKPPKPEYTKVCPTCNREFTTTFGQRKYCKKSHHPSNKEGKRIRKRFTRDAKPPWESWKAIADFYAACPEGMHVDHIIPLNHPDVCGLHCIVNLQYLPVKENSAKSNRWDGTKDNLNWSEK
jgi:hypothetical protein